MISTFTHQTGKEYYLASPRFWLKHCEDLTAHDTAGFSTHRNVFCVRRASPLREILNFEKEFFNLKGAQLNGSCSWVHHLETTGTFYCFVASEH